jgi:hypothetical protein
MASALGPVSRPPGAYDIFVSYASANKEAVLAVVASLRELGYSVWVDNHQIDSMWTQQAAKAINDALAVLFFASEASFESKNTLNELMLARKKRKTIFSVYLEKAEPPNDFELLLIMAQDVYAYSVGEEEVLPAICKKLQANGVQPRPTTEILEPAETVLETSAPAFIGAHPITPYLIGRRIQESEIKEALALHRDSYPRRPIVFVVHGDQEQALNEYVDRFQQYTLPKALTSMRREGYCGTVKRLDLPWIDQDWESNSARTLSRLRDELLEREGLGSGDWPNQFAAELAKIDAVPVICYHLFWQNWNDSHLRTLKAWVLEWAELPDLPLGSPIVVLFSIMQYPAERTRFSFMRRPKSPRVEIAKFGELTSNDLLVVPLTELGNIDAGDIDDWIRNVVKPRDPSRMIKRFHELLDDPAIFGADGIPMSRFVDLAARAGAMDLLSTEDRSHSSPLEGQ